MGEPGTSAGGESTTNAAPQGACRLEDIDPEVLAGMTADELTKFIDTGRSGRRNALPDVNQPDIVTTSTAGVAEAMENLQVQSGASTSSEKNTDKEGAS